jgi:hypothetical protein
VWSNEWRALVAAAEPENRGPRRRPERDGVSRLSDSNRRPAVYKTAALAN